MKNTSIYGLLLGLSGSAGIASYALYDFEEKAWEKWILNLRGKIKDLVKTTKQLIGNFSDKKNLKEMQTKFLAIEELRITINKNKYRSSKGLQDKIEEHKKEIEELKQKIEKENTKNKANLAEIYHRIEESSILIAEIDDEMQRLLEKFDILDTQIKAHKDKETFKKIEDLNDVIHQNNKEISAESNIETIKNLKNENAKKEEEIEKELERKDANFAKTVRLWLNLNHKITRLWDLISVLENIYLDEKEHKLEIQKET